AARAPPRLARVQGAWRRAHARRPRRVVRRRAHRARGRLPGRARVGARARRHPVAPDQVRAADDRSAARARRRVRPVARRTMTKPLVEMPRATRAAIRGVLADIDDTVTTEGKLTSQAYRA